MLTLKPFIRSIKKRKTLSVITIGGYAIGLAVLLIMVSFIISEKSVNRSFENRKNIYRIVRSDGETFIPTSLKDNIRTEVPGVEKMSFYNLTTKRYSYNDSVMDASVIVTDDEFLNIFSFKFIYQVPDPTLSFEKNVILTQSFSEKLFGKTNPIGNSLQLSDEEYTVVGVVNDVPPKASFNFDIMLCKDIVPRITYIHLNNKSVHYYSFIQLNEKVDIETVEQQISGISFKWIDKNYTFSIEPFNDIYFNTELDDKMEHANTGMIYLLLSIAVVIFFMTIFNYTNLTISSGYERLKEIGIKKTAGAGNKDIFWQVLNEAMFVSFIAIVIAIFVAYLITPLFSELLGEEINLNFLFSQPMVIIGGILLFLLTGILSGIYPALSFSKLLPLQIISRKRSPKNTYRQGAIIAVQFVITICLIISVLFINKQLEYVKHADLGFNRNLLRVGINGIFEYEPFRQELLKNSNIVSASASSGAPMRHVSDTELLLNSNGKEFRIPGSVMTIDENFVSTLGLKIIHGRNIDEQNENECLINEHLYRKLGGEKAFDTEIYSYKIVGVIDDFNFHNLYSPIGNLVLRDEEFNFYSYLIKFSGDVELAKESISRTAKEFEISSTISFQFYDEYVQSFYTKEEKQAQSVTLFSIIAVFISCLGLIGMIEQTTHRKIKEIGIRKVNGAKVSEILALLNTNIIKWVIIAFIVATPISFYIMNKWLQSFAYKTELSWWVFALSGLLALGIALLTVSFQSLRAATRNPVEALRYE